MTTFNTGHPVADGIANVSSRWGLLALGVLVVSAVGRLMEWDYPVVWAVDLFSHWYLLIGATASVVLPGLGFAYLRRKSRTPAVLRALRMWASVAAALLATGAIITADQLPGTNEMTENSRTLTVITANVNSANPDISALLNWAEAQSADIVLVQEVSEGLAQQLSKDKRFPYQATKPRHDNFGLATLSRYPLVEVQYSEINVDTVEMPRILASVAKDGQVIPVLNAHPMPPISRQAHEQRGALVRMLDDLSQKAPTMVVGGDFNATPMSVAFAGMRSLRFTKSLATTWLFVLHIDHILATDAWRVVRSAVGPGIGSDHRPVVVTLTGAPTN